jgi:hypothetical protein
VETTWTRKKDALAAVFSGWRGDNYFSAWHCANCGEYGGLEIDDLPATEDSADAHTCYADPFISAAEAALRKAREDSLNIGIEWPEVQK